jgi:hypothetical protein
MHFAVTNKHIRRHTGSRYRSSQPSHYDLDMKFVHRALKSNAMPQMINISVVASLLSNTLQLLSFNYSKTGQRGR